MIKSKNKFAKDGIDVKKKLATILVLLLLLVYITGCIQGADDHDQEDDHSHEEGGHSHHGFQDVLHEYGDFIFTLAYLQSHLDHLPSHEIIEYLEDMSDYLEQEETKAINVLDLIKEDYDIDITNATLTSAISLEEDDLKAISNSVYALAFSATNNSLEVVMRPQVAITIYNLYSAKEMYHNIEQGITKAIISSGFY